MRCVFKSYLRTEVASGIVCELGSDAGMHVAGKQPDAIFTVRSERVCSTTIEFHFALCTRWIFDRIYHKVLLACGCVIWFSLGLPCFSII